MLQVAKSLEDGETIYYDVKKNKVVTRNTTHGDWDPCTDIQSLLINCLSEEKGTSIEIQEPVPSFLLDVLFDIVSGYLEDNRVFFNGAITFTDDGSKFRLGFQKEASLFRLDKVWLWKYTNSEYSDLVGLMKRDILTDFILSLISEDLHQEFLRSTGFNRETFVATKIERKSIVAVDIQALYKYGNMRFMDWKQNVLNLNLTDIFIYAFFVQPGGDVKEEKVEKEGEVLKMNVRRIEMGGVVFTVMSNGDRLIIEDDRGYSAEYTGSLSRFQLYK